MRLITIILRLDLLADYYRSSPFVIPRLALAFPRLFRTKCPPLSLLGWVTPAELEGSTFRGRFSDEPFRLRDIQFDQP